MISHQYLMISGSPKRKEMSQVLLQSANQSTDNYEAHETLCCDITAPSSQSDLSGEPLLPAVDVWWVLLRWKLINTINNILVGKFLHIYHFHHELLNNLKKFSLPAVCRVKKSLFVCLVTFSQFRVKQTQKDQKPNLRPTFTASPEDQRSVQVTC